MLNDTKTQYVVSIKDHERDHSTGPDFLGVVSAATLVELTNEVRKLIKDSRSLGKLDYASEDGEPRWLNADGMIFIDCDSTLAIFAKEISGEESIEAQSPKLELIHLLGYEMPENELWEENALARFRLPNGREVTVSLHQEGYKRSVSGEKWFTDLPEAFKDTQVRPDELWDLVHQATSDGTSHGLEPPKEQAHELKIDGDYALRGA